jgi:hypothetical protein
LLKYTGEYPQAPFEEIDEDTYNKLVRRCPRIDVKEIIYEDSTRMQQAACAGGSCEVSF